jgi:Tripartite tricarboxylate transporter TctB family
VRTYSDAGNKKWAETELVEFLFRIRRDYYAGALMVLIGAVAINEGRNYQLGTLQKMGPGYFPMMLGALLILLGILIAGTASTGGNEEQEALPHAEWRGWACIIAGPALFILFGRYLGLLPATFACVFVAALGDRDTTLRGAAILSASVTVFGILLFSYILKVSMPILKWGF